MATSEKLWGGLPSDASLSGLLVDPAGEGCDDSESDTDGALYDPWELVDELSEGFGSLEPGRVEEVVRLARDRAALRTLRGAAGRRQAATDRRLRALEARVADLRTDGADGRTAADLADALTAERGRHEVERRSVAAQTEEVEVLRGGILQAAARRRAAAARLVAAESVTQTALARAQNAEEALRSLGRVSALDALVNADEAAAWLDDLTDVVRRAAAARSPDPAELSCVVCLDAPRNVACFPCGHLALCSACVRDVTDCPLCREQIREHRRLFFNDVRLADPDAAPPAPPRRTPSPSAPS